LLQRLQEHNSGKSPSTRHRRPLILLYFEEYATRREALNRERECKSLEGGAALKAHLIAIGLLNSSGFIDSSAG
jgi:putative endonuclease